jgi:hypothetical protein
MQAVANASPIMNLTIIGRLDLLPHVFGRVMIPKAVWNEVVVDGANRPGVSDVESAEWLQVVPAENDSFVRALRQELDAGEAEAIALAVQCKADLLLMDEKIGRETAAFLGIEVMGLAGLLYAAKRKGLIAAIGPELDALRHKAGFWISDRLVEQVLRDAGERL